MVSVAPGFWAGWILSITIVSLIALAWLSASVYFAADGADVTHEVWDETLREGTAPAPLWWFWLLVGLLATSVVYLILYPGLGTYRGALRWSQGGEIAASLASYDAAIRPGARAARRGARGGVAARRGRDEGGLARLQQSLHRLSRTRRARPSAVVPGPRRRQLAMGRRRAAAHTDDRAGAPGRDAAVAGRARRRRRREGRGLRAGARERLRASRRRRRDAVSNQLQRVPRG